MNFRLFFVGLSGWLVMMAIIQILFAMSRGLEGMWPELGFTLDMLIWSIPSSLTSYLIGYKSKKYQIVQAALVIAVGSLIVFFLQFQIILTLFTGAHWLGVLWFAILVAINLLPVAALFAYFGEQCTKNT